MKDEPYQANKIPDHWPTSPKRAVLAHLVAVSGLRLVNRGTLLMHPRSRSFPRYSIAELTGTDENKAAPGERVGSVLYIGFLEVTQGGIITVGQEVKLNGKRIGHVAGFSDVHEPNHLNVLLRLTSAFSDKYMQPYSDGTMVNLERRLGDEVSFEGIDESNQWNT